MFQLDIFSYGGWHTVNTVKYKPTNSQVNSFSLVLFPFEAEVEFVKLVECSKYLWCQKKIDILVVSCCDDNFGNVKSN